MMRLGDGWLYARKSAYHGRLRYRGRSVDEQLIEERDWAADNDVRVAGEFIDDDRSASPMAEDPREAFEAMIAAIESGQIKRGDVVVAWEASRLHRDLDVYVKLRRVCAKAGVYWCYNGELFDLTKRSDRRRTAADAVDAEDRAWEISEQVQRALRANAREGRPHGRQQFGYTRIYDSRTGDLVRVIKNVEEAAVVKELFDRVFAHEAQYTIMKDFNERGIRSPSGAASHRDLGSALARIRDAAGLSIADVALAMRWKDSRVERIEAATWGIRLDELQALCDLYDAPETTRAALERRWRELPQWTTYAQFRTILTNRAYIGRRHHNKGTEEHEAIWPAIVSEEVFHAVNLLLKDPKRRSARTTKGSHLLTSLIECGKPGCGGVSNAQWRGPRNAALRPCRKDESPAGVRDVALLVVLEATGGQCDEVAAVRAENFDQESGLLRILGENSRRIALNDYVARCVGRWLDIRGRAPGPLFCPIEAGAVRVAAVTAKEVRVIANARRVQAGLQPLSPEEIPLVFTGEYLGHLTYRCSEHACFGARAVDVDSYVVAQLVIRFARRDAAELFRVPDPSDGKMSDLRAKIEKWQGDLAEAEDLVTAGELTMTRLANLEAKIVPLIVAAERQLQRAVVNPLVERLLQPDAEGVYAEWRRLSLRQKRAVIRSELRIVITPVGMGRRNVPVEEYVDLSWRRDHVAEPPPASARPG